MFSILLLDLTIFSEGTTGRILQESPYTAGGIQALTVDICLSTCQDAGYSLAGLEFGQECCKFIVKIPNMA
jgi:hypothetical protein